MLESIVIGAIYRFLYRRICTLDSIVYMKNNFMLCITRDILIFNLSGLFILLSYTSREDSWFWLVKCHGLIVMFSWLLRELNKADDEYLSEISVCNFSPFVFCILFGIIKQIWHPCGVFTRNNFLSSWLSPHMDVIFVYCDIGTGAYHYTNMTSQWGFLQE